MKFQRNALSSSRTLSRFAITMFTLLCFTLVAATAAAVSRADAPPTLRNALADRQVTQSVSRASPAATVIEQTRFVVTRETSTAKWLESRRESVFVAYSF